MGFSGMFEALLLIALGFGYIVLYLAKREDKRLQFLGYFLGAVIITLSLTYLVINVLTQAFFLAPKTRYYNRSIIQPSKSMPRPMPQQAPAQKP